MYSTFLGRNISTLIIISIIISLTLLVVGCDESEPDFDPQDYVIESNTSIPIATFTQVPNTFTPLPTFTPTATATKAPIKIIIVERERPVIVEKPIFIERPVEVPVYVYPQVPVYKEPVTNCCVNSPDPYLPTPVRSSWE